MDSSKKISGKTEQPQAKRLEASYESGDFTKGIHNMFNQIAPTYDLLNRINTFGLDLAWRRQVAQQVALEAPQDILDLAAGTGDLSIELAKRCPAATIVACDLSEEMLRIAEAKASYYHVEDRVLPCVADAMQLPFRDKQFDAITIAFGVRNFEDLLQGYQEMYRVLKPGGILAVLELSEPRDRRLLYPLYRCYTTYLLPFISKYVSGEKAAYRYLTQSIKVVPQRQRMLRLMEQAGFRRTFRKVCCPPVATLYVGYKPRFPEIEALLPEHHSLQ